MSEKIATGDSGTFTITAPGARVIKCPAIWVGADAVLANLEVDGVAADVRADVIDVVGGTFPAGTIIRPKPPAKLFTNVNLTSGIIVEIK